MKLSSYSKYLPLTAMMVSNKMEQTFNGSNTLHCMFSISRKINVVRKTNCGLGLEYEY